MTSYQKLKRDCEQAKQDVITLLEGKNFLRIAELKAMYRMMKETERQIWYGNPK